MPGMKKAIKRYALLAIMLLSGCAGSDQRLHPEKYMVFLEQESNELKRTVTAGDTKYTVQLATPEYMVCKQFTDKWDNLDTNAFKVRLSELKGHIFFLINISGKATNEASVKEWMLANSQVERMVLYYEDRAAEDLSLLDGNETRKPVVYHFENNYGLAPYNTIVVGFEKPAMNNCQLVFNDRFSGNPYIRVSYQEKDFKKLPHLLLTRN